MRSATRLKFALGSSVGLAALMVAAPAVASAAPGSGNVPCTQAALVAAINAANAAGGGTINLAQAATTPLRLLTMAGTACRWSRHGSPSTGTAPPSTGPIPSASWRSTARAGTSPSTI